jgi:hypothetical protein
MRWYFAVASNQYLKRRHVQTCFFKSKHDASKSLRLTGDWESNIPLFGDYAVLGEQVPKEKADTFQVALFP